MRTPETMADARRALEICNACRYCEGFCAVFPAMELRREFAAADLQYLANLCHNCRSCYYSCQYAPPHEFGLNLPRTLAELRAVTYAEYSWPGALSRLFQRNGLVVGLALGLGIAAVLLLTVLLQPAQVLYAAHQDPGAFYAVIPYGAMVGVAGVTFGFALLAMFVSTARFWRRTGSGGVPTPRAWLGAAGDVLTLRN
ncbi:MAG TPA: tricarballylate utilization 4Fe-4S protein TcuB, partial [bacterium]|nr:tricarballylate utilization 4Fe-4S protein TcuB [bacterium]